MSVIYVSNYLPRLTTVVLMLLVQETPPDCEDYHCLHQHLATISVATVPAIADHLQIKPDRNVVWVFSF